MVDWLNPINRVKIQAAIVNRADSVTLDGRRFSIRYHTNDTKAVLKPDKGFVPRGTFDIDTVLRPEWLVE